MKNLFSREDFHLDELIFQNRNQEYGAYNLRHDSDNMLTKAMFVGVFFFGAVAATPFIINSFKTVEIKQPKTTHDGEIILKPVDVLDEIVTPPQSLPQPEPQVATSIYEIPTPAKNPPVETPGTSVIVFIDKKIGLENIAGPAPTGEFKPPIVNVGPSTVAPPAVIPKPVVQDFPTRVDVEAKYVSGINAFRNSMSNNFDTSYFEGTGEIVRTTLTFIVEKDGTISDIKANGSNTAFNKEAIQTIKSIKGKWTPAKLDGQFVRSYFSFPVSMQFE